MKNDFDVNQDNQIEFPDPDDLLMDDEIEEFAELFDDNQPRELSKAEQLQYDQYAPRIRWNVNGGMNHDLMHKLYSLFADKESKFHLKNLSTLEATDHDIVDEEIVSYTFQSDINDHQAILYKPSTRNATYAISSKDRSLEQLTSDFITTLESVKETCTQAEAPIRFIIPFSENPDQIDKGARHAVLLVIDYSPATKTMKPIVFDSIGRDTLADTFSNFWRQKDQSTADYILNKEIKRIFQPSDVHPEDLDRVAYNHQNRALEGNCGSYTFVSTHQTLQSFIDGKSMDDFINSIPASGYINSNSFLDDSSKEELTNCINFRSLTSEQIDTQLQNLGNDNNHQALMDEEHLLEEFEDALIMYKTIRTAEEEKSYLNFFGYDKDRKVQATDSLIEVLQCLKTDTPIPHELHTQLLSFKAELCNGRLANLVNFHLQQLGLKSIGSLLNQSAKPVYDIDDEFGFVLIPSDEEPAEKEKSEFEEDDALDLSSTHKNTPVSEEESLNPPNSLEYRDKQLMFKNEMINLRESQEESELSISLPSAK